MVLTEKSAEAQFESLLASVESVLLAARSNESKTEIPLWMSEFVTAGPRGARPFAAFETKFASGSASVMIRKSVGPPAPAPSAAGPAPHRRAFLLSPKQQKLRLGTSAQLALLAGVPVDHRNARLVSQSLSSGEPTADQLQYVDVNVRSQILQTFRSSRRRSPGPPTSPAGSRLHTGPLPAAVRASP